MRQIGVHDDDEIPLGVLEPVDVGRPEAELLLSRPQHDGLVAVDLLQLLGHIESAVGRAVVDHDDLEIELFQVLHQQPNDDGQVFALVVRGQEDGIFDHGRAVLPVTLLGLPQLVQSWRNVNM